MRRAPDPLGFNPLHLLGVYKHANGSFYLYENRWVVLNLLTQQGEYQWLPYQDYTQAVSFPAYLQEPDAGRIRLLSTGTSEYDYVAQDGHKNIGAWIDAAANTGWPLMPIITKSQVLRYATLDTLAKAKNASRILEEETATKRPSYDVFFSHSYDDRAITSVRKDLSKERDTLYLLIGSKTTAQSQQGQQSNRRSLRSYMDICRCLIYAYSPSIGDSKWCPWELGYFDGKNGKAYVMPIIDEPSQSYVGRGTCRSVSNRWEEKAKNGEMNLYVFAGGTYFHLRKVIDN